MECWALLCICWWNEAGTVRPETRARVVVHVCAAGRWVQSCHLAINLISLLSLNSSEFDKIMNYLLITTHPSSVLLLFWFSLPPISQLSSSLWVSPSFYRFFNGGMWKIRFWDLGLVYFAEIWWFLRWVPFFFNGPLCLVIFLFI